jgi:hypothetical protein
MTTPGSSSGTWGFSPSNSELVFEAFDRIGVRPEAITRHHLTSARNSLGYELIRWTNNGAPLWKIVTGTINLLAGTATYTLPASLVTLTEVYLSLVNGNGTGQNSDVVLTPVTRTEFAQIPNKNSPGNPVQFWFEMLATPQVTFWQNPSIGAPTYVVNWYGLQQIQDAGIGGGETPDVVYRGLDALASALALRLFTKFGPANPMERQARLAELKEQAATSWSDFVTRDQEMGPRLIQPNIGIYGHI